MQWGTRGAHVKEGLHRCDMVRVEAQWLVEIQRILRSRRGKHRKRGSNPVSMRRWVAAWCVWGEVGASCLPQGRTRARAKSTLNIARMLVTPEVSQYDTSALNVALHGAFCIRLSMFVTALTSQRPIDPCVASAAAWSAQNSTSAASSSALVANTVDGEAGG